MKLVCCKYLGALRPTDVQGDEAFTKIKNGDLVTIEITKPRNVQHHRKFFAMMTIVYQNQEHYKSMDELLDWVKLNIGHYETSIGKFNGQVFELKRPKSISFAAMANDDFAEFYERAVTWVLSAVIPGLSKHSLDVEVENELRKF